ncbi:MAG: ABC transporter permease subunit, partial [Burkholderiaceae bacterium]|nr:ABC transporter permease subunit [Burkholderiaceae bacterium]
MSWEIIFETEQLLAYWHGLLTTLSLLLSSLGIGAVLAVACALALTNGPWVLQKLVGSFTYFVRGTPLLIQVYLIYYGLAQLDWIQERWDAVWPWTHFKEPFFCALLAFALNTGGYTAEMLAGAIR